MSKEEMNQQVPGGQASANQQQQPQAPQTPTAPPSFQQLNGNPSPVFPQPTPGVQQSAPSQENQGAPIFPNTANQQMMGVPQGQANQEAAVAQPAYASPSGQVASSTVSQGTFAQAQVPYQAVGQAPAARDPRRVKRIIWSIVGVVGAIVILVLGFLLYRLLSGNVSGEYKVNDLSNSLTKDLKNAELSDSSIAYSDFTEGAQVQLDIKDETVTATVTYSTVYDDFYAAMKSDYSSSFSDEKSNFTDDEWNYLMNTLITNEFSEKDFDKELDKEAADKGLEYDSHSGMVTGTVFEGKLNRVNGSIEITDVNQDLDLGDFDEGQKISYKKTSDGLILTDEDGDEMTAKKE